MFRSALLPALVAVLFLAFGVGTAGHADAAPGDCTAGNPLQPTAELFATDNTAAITDPADPRLRTQMEGFELAVSGTALRNMALPVGSTLVSGVFWSRDRHQMTYERSRQFRLACVGALSLGHIARQVCAEFRQESVLTFQPLPAQARRTDAFRVEIPGVDVRRLHDALIADRVMRERLGGGSVTDTNTLILVADIADFGLVRDFAARLGWSWNAVTVHYGDREFIS